MSIEGVRHVLIVGTYCGLNKGDRLMQDIAASLVLQNDYVPIISSPFPDIDKTLYSNVRIEKCRRRNLPLSFLQCLILALLPFGLREKYARNNKELKTYISSSYIIDTSGDMLTEDYGIHVAISHMIPLIYCVFLKKRFIVLAQSIGPFKKLTIPFVKILSKASTISARDEITYKYLVNLGLKNVVSVADLGFLLKTKSIKSNVVERLKNIQACKLVGICPSALYFQKFLKGDSEENLEKFCGMLNKISNEQKIAYVVVPHVSTPNRKMDDAILSETIKNKLNVNCVTLDSKLEPAETKYLISQLDAMISFRMHGAISSVDSFVPTIIISYSHKAIGLFEKLGLNKWVVGSSDDYLVALEDKLVQLLENRQKVVEHLHDSIPMLRVAAEKNKEIIKSMG